jgi:hypothetical protein
LTGVSTNSPMNGISSARSRPMRPPSR